MAQSRHVKELEKLKYDFTPSATQRKIALLHQLERRRLARAGDVLALHEFLLFARAFPQDATVLALAERLLEGFDKRVDLRRHRRALADTGIVGTTLYFRFFWLTAIWLERRWPEHLTVDWPEFERKARVAGLLHHLVSYSETPGLDEFDFAAREWVDRLKGPKETDAAFLIRRFQALRVPTPMREQVYEDLDIPLVLSPGATTPARGREKWDKAPVVFQKRPPPRSRPNLRRAIRESSFQVRPVDRRDRQRLIDLANACMVTRHRDLLVFLYADERDVRIIDCGDGLQFVCMGAVPERRLLLESVYGFLTLMNGVPIGYVLCSALFNSSEVAYNVFDTYRGAGAAHVYARVLGMVHQLFGSTSFAVDPYQLGHDNKEGQESGAWWFYYKLGFRTRDAGVRALVREELGKLKANPRYRTRASRLNEMAAESMFLQLGRARRDVLGQIALGNIGLHVSRYLAGRFGSDRERGLTVCAGEVERLLGLRSFKKLPAGERLAWQRWAPLVSVLPEIRRWTPTQKKALRAVIRAKGGRRESDYVRLFDGHARLRRALLQLTDQDVS